VKEIGLEEKVTGQQASKKCENLKQKYKVYDVNFKLISNCLMNVSTSRLFFCVCLSLSQFLESSIPDTHRPG